MKNILFVIVFFSLYSCQPLVYYQMFETKVVNGEQNDSQIIFEDENCKVTYNLWGLNGDVGFKLYNKTDKYLTIDFSKSYWVSNGKVSDYYLNRSYTTSQSTSSAVNNNYYWSTGLRSVSGSANIGESSTAREKSERTLPPGTSIEISQFSVQSTLYTDCQFELFPKNKKIPSVGFEIGNSPHRFYNLLNYRLENSELIEMRNEFFIERITNYPGNQFFKLQKNDRCGNPYITGLQVFKFKKADAFYIKYLKER